jgi:hypothetical protein
MYFWNVDLVDFVKVASEQLKTYILIIYNIDTTIHPKPLH